MNPLCIIIPEGGETMLNILAGRARGMQARLVREAGRLLGAGQVYVVVPKQLTLETELLLIRALEPAGSFRLRVLSPERLCGHIFESAGHPAFQRVDDRGRVMLARRAVKACAGDLKAYARAGERRGFPARVAKELEALRQAGLSPDDVRALADGEAGLFSAKLSDLAKILEAYEASLAGRSLDGEAEFLDAAARAGKSEAAKAAGILVYGFDVMPRPLHALIAALSAACDVAVLFAADPDPDAPDADAFLPVSHSIGRLMKEAKLAGAPVRRETVPAEDVAPRGIAHLEKNLFAARPEILDGAPVAVRLVSLKDPQAEALYAASRCRELAENGARWSDILVVCPDAAAYAGPLEDAFAAFSIPIFLSSSRPASRHALAEALLSALALVSKGYRTEDALALLRTCYAGVTGDEADRLANYLFKYAPRGRALQNTFVRGGGEAEAVEPIREKLVKPVNALRARLREAKNLKAQLAALFSYLTDIGAHDESLARQKALADTDLFRLAGEESQVWNRIVLCLDQAASLMGEGRLPVREIAELLRESLDAAVIKPLPQSGDAVYAQSADRAVSRPARCVILMGLVDRIDAGSDGLLSDYQLTRLSQAAGRYLGADGGERALMRRYYMKSALAAAREAVDFTYPLSGADGSAQRPAALVGDLKRLLPDLREEGGATEPFDRLAAPGAALRAVGARLSEPRSVRALSTLTRTPGKQVLRLLSAFDAASAAEQLRPETAKRIYGALSEASVTRLEAFGRCPFFHFMRYALSPEKAEPFELSVRDEGGFFHDAVRGFLEETRADIAQMAPAEAQTVMDEVSDILLERMEAGEKFDSAVRLAERRRLKATVRAAAEALVRQLAGSKFSPVDLELSFGKGDGAALQLKTAEGPCALEGRIDRVDEYVAPEEGFLRVIDYKRGNTELRLCEAYYGLQLQLIAYLAAAMNRRGEAGAGVYYFKIDEGIISDQTTDPAAIEEKRRASMKLNGLTTTDLNVIAAMSPEPEDVISIRINKDGSFSKTSAGADPLGMRLIINRVLKNAARHVDGIRAGEAAAAPARTRKRNPCTYCDYRRGCLFDESLDTPKVRRVDEISNAEVMDRLLKEAAEEGDL
jgi:ATP-dependent helicase/nuclease subunit B